MMMRPRPTQLSLFPEEHPVVVPWLEPLSVQLLRAHQRERWTTEEQLRMFRTEEVARNFHGPGPTNPLPVPPMQRVLRVVG